MSGHVVYVVQGQLGDIYTSIGKGGVIFIVSVKNDGAQVLNSKPQLSDYNEELSAYLTKNNLISLPK